MGRGAKGMIEILAVIEAPHFYAGIVLQGDVVAEAADILKYMRKWTRDQVRDYCATKGWKISIVTISERAPCPT